MKLLIPKLALFIAITFISAFVFACSGNGNGLNLSQPSQSFCEYVYEEKLETAKEIINDFIKELDTNLDVDIKIIMLRNWLNNYYCVLDVGPFLITTFTTGIPPHNEVHIDFFITFATKNGPKEKLMSFII